MEPSEDVNGEVVGENVGEDVEDTSIEKCLRDAEEIKQEGNEHFRAGQWGEALALYSTGLAKLPKRKEPVVDQKVAKGDDDGEDDKKTTAKEPEPESSTSTNHDADAENEERPDDKPSELDATCATARAILNANIGACYVKLKEHKNAADACTQSLLDDPHYVKALKRRAETNEIIDSWSSLSTAKEDYTTLLQILPPSSPDVAKIKRSLWNLQPRIDAAQKRDTAEMLEKLKGLGNSILGNFGLSTDNFKFEPNGQGGYSMNFQR